LASKYSGVNNLHKIFDGQANFMGEYFLRILREKDVVSL
jgi:hypothetical protein